MRVLSLNHPARDYAGGAAGSSLMLNEAMRRAGVDVEEVYADDALPGVPESRRRREELPIALGRIALRRAREFDVVEMTGPTGYLAFPLLRARRRRPVLVNRSFGLEHFDHHLRIEEHRRGRLDLSLRYHLGMGFLTLREVELSILASDLFISLRPGACDWVVDHHLKRMAACAVTGCGVEDEFLTAQRPEIDPGRVGWLGSRVERKGWRDFVDGFSAAARHEPLLTASVMGAGAQAAADFPADVRSRVTSFSRLDQDALVRELARCHVFVAASLSEGYHIAVLQAMAIGLPVIATREGFLADLPADQDLFAEIGKRDPAGLAVALERGARGDLDAFGPRGRTFAQERSWDRVAARTIGVLEAAQASKGL